MSKNYQATYRIISSDKRTAEYLRIIKSSGSGELFDGALYRASHEVKDYRHRFKAHNFRDAQVIALEHKEEKSIDPYIVTISLEEIIEFEVIRTTERNLEKLKRMV